MIKKLLRTAASAGVITGLIFSITLAARPAAALGCPTIRMGDNNACVRQAQTKLGLLGFMPSALNTGRFLSVTDKAVRDFQAYAGLPADGIVGPQTWARLDSTSVASMSPYGVPPVCVKTGMTVCVSKRTQKLYLFRDGHIVLTLDARFGDARGPEFATAEGLYSITNKVKDEVSIKYNNAPMPYTNYFYNGQAIHFSYDFAAGDASNTSHGCIRLRDENGAATIFNYVPVNTPVFIWS